MFHKLKHILFGNIQCYMFHNFFFSKNLFGNAQCYMFHNFFFVYDIVCVLSAYTYVRIDLLNCFIFQSLVNPRDIAICDAG